MNEELSVRIRPAEDGDLLEIARINTDVFLGNRDNVEAATKWVKNLSLPKDIYRYFVIESSGEFAGYIGWKIEGGFLRPIPCVELEQLGINPRFEGHGLGTVLSKETLETYVVPWIKHSNNRIESDIHAIVWFRADNKKAENVYRKAGFTELCGVRAVYGDRLELCLKRRINFTARAW